MGIAGLLFLASPAAAIDGVQRRVKRWRGMNIKKCLVGLTNYNKRQLLGK